MNRHEIHSNYESSATRWSASSAGRKGWRKRSHWRSESVWMCDPDSRQRMLPQDFVEEGPSDGASSISPRQPLLPYPHGLVGEPLQSSLIAADTIVGEVAPHH